MDELNGKREVLPASSRGKNHLTVPKPGGNYGGNGQSGKAAAATATAEHGPTDCLSFADKAEGKCDDESGHECVG